MEQDRMLGPEHSLPRKPLPGRGDDAWRTGARDTTSATAWRDSGVTRVRRASNWTAAALIAGVAVTTGYFIHAASALPAVTTSTQSGAVQGSAHQPSLGHHVVTSGGSGVTVGSSGGAQGSAGSLTWRDN